MAEKVNFTVFLFLDKKMGSQRERDLEIPRYVRYRKKHIDDLDLTQVAWVPEIEGETVQEEDLSQNALGVISEVERMLFIPPERDFRFYLFI